MLTKVENVNLGYSMKNRMTLKKIEMAEEQGKLKPGATVIECTSGNTGMGLALAAIAKGYKCIFTLADKQSQEKIDALRALGAEVYVTPTNVEPDDPRSYYSVARQKHEEIENSVFINQYDNPGNAIAHYESTGPEIWEQTEGKITHYCVGVGTGGTISGVSKYIKEQKPSLYTIGIDSYGSVFKKYKETGEFDRNEIYSYSTEGIGEDILPKNVNFDVIDEFIKVTDKDGALMTRRLAKEEGMFVGWSCGSAVHGALEYAKDNLKEDDVMVIVLHDHGTRYLGKIYNDEWMKKMGFLEDRNFKTAQDIIDSRDSRDLISVPSRSTVAQAVQLMSEKGISQLVVKEGEEVVGSLRDDKILSSLIDNPEIKSGSIREVMDNSFPVVAPDNTLDVLSSMIKQHKAILVRDQKNGDLNIITEQDLLSTLTK